MSSIAAQMPLSPGKSFKLLDIDVTVATTQKAHYTLDAEESIIWVYVDNIAAGETVSVNVYGHVGKVAESKRVLLREFSTLDDTFNDSLSVRKTGAAPGLIQVEVVSSGAAKLEVWARGSSTGESTVQILGNNTGKNYKKTANTTPSVIVPAAATSRSGVQLFNNSTTETVYWGYSAAEADPSVGMLLFPQTPQGIDIGAGVEIYATTVSGSAEIRIAEAGV